MTRISEALSIMKQLYDLGFDREYEPLKDLSKKLSHYVKTGEPETFVIEMELYGRVAHVTLPKNPESRIELILKSFDSYSKTYTT